MKRREFIALICGVAASPFFAGTSGPFAAAAQKEAKVARLAYLSSHSPERFRIAVFRETLAALGWREGENLIIDYASADGRFDRLPRLASELVERGPDALFAVPTVSALAAKRATETIPIIFSHVSDPIGSGLVTSLARPSGNLTGFTHFNAGLSPKRLSLLKEAVPELTRLGALWHSEGFDESTQADILREARDAAYALRLHLEVLTVREPSELEAAFAAMTRAQVGALIVLPNPLFLNEHRAIVGHAAKNELPGVYFMREFAEAGGLISYGADLDDMVRGAAGYVSRILNGTKPADLPVQAPTKFELVINLKTARALGIAIPPSLLAHADEVIE
jgi:putative tryptophan/tyrosine transport system substrate-binding protein